MRCACFRVYFLVMLLSVYGLLFSCGDMAKAESTSPTRAQSTALPTQKKLPEKKSVPSSLSESKPEPVLTTPSKPEPSPTTPSRPEPSDDSGVPEIMEFFKDPEIQLFAKTKDHLEQIAESLKTGKTSESLIKDINALFELLKIRLLQNDEKKVDIVVEHLLRLNLNNLKKLVAAMKKKNEKMTQLLQDLFPKANPKNKAALQKLSDINIDYASLRGKITGHISTMASLKGIVIDFD